MIKLIAFDWNGTLLSDTATLVKADNVALKAVGVKPISLTKFRQCFDMPIIKYYKNLGMSEEFYRKHLQKIEDIFHASYEKNSDHTRSRSGVREVLNWLEKNQIGKIIYSNHNVPNIHRKLVRLKLDKLIDVILANPIPGENPQLFVRHKQEKLIQYVKQQKLKPNEVVSVGDTEEEIEIGKQYGYHTVGITGGYNTAARLKKHKPDFLIHNMKELIGVVKKLNK
jgi:phosphoglycolate phosphatase-like HAD superfamily hydrolase